jgi:iron complex outermembrane receptor protein
LFSGAPGAMTPAQVEWFRLDQTAEGNSQQRIVSATIAGDLGGIGIRSPLAEAPVEFALGFEHRDESAFYRPEETLATGNNIQYGPIPPAGGEYRVTEWFAEGRVPLIENQPWTRSLGIEAGYRRSK